jgi:hypothetical protein
MRTRIMISIAILAFSVSACTDTFLVGKGRTGYFFGANHTSKYSMLCTSGDLEKVLFISSLSQSMKDTIYKYNCSNERSGEKVKQIYASMTAEERKDIKNAFRKNGYEINHILC